MTGRLSRVVLIALPMLLVAGMQVGAALVGSRDASRFRYPLDLREAMQERCEALAQRREVRAEPCGCVLDELQDTTPQSRAWALADALPRHGNVPKGRVQEVEAALETCS
jgi:hypothetical protein